MARTTPGRTADVIQEAAADLFYRRGYAATSLREIAAEVGIQVGSLYNHIDGKNQLLRTLMLRIMNELLAAMEEATAAAGSPVQRLERAVDCHIRFHATHSRDVFIGNTELRSLSAEDRSVVIEQRDRYEEILRAIVEEVCAQRLGDAIDVQLQTYAIVAIGTHVASWYKPDGPLSLDEVVSAYTETVMRQLDIRETARASAV